MKALSNWLEDSASGLVVRGLLMCAAFVVSFVLLACLAALVALPGWMTLLGVLALQVWLWNRGVKRWGEEAMAETRNAALVCALVLGCLYLLLMWGQRM